MRELYRFGILFSLVLFVVACNHKQPAGMVIIDATNPAIPVIKVPLTKHQHKKIKKGRYGNVSSLFILNNGVAVAQSVDCQYRVQGDTLFYKPLQPLGIGLQFVAKVYGDADTTQTIFTVHPAQTAQPHVLAIYPLADTLPANILMFHAVFSAPMAEDVQAYEKVKLLNEKGEEKQMVWRHKSNWTSDGQHLVLMVHPGRVKRDIRYFEEGDVLFEPGKKYTLVITTELKDRNNRPLKTEFTKEFIIKPHDHEMPAVVQHIENPQTGTRQPVKINFTEGMDYGSMLIGWEVATKAGKKINGNITAFDDKSWWFTPAELWENGTYNILLNDYAGDYCGNHLTRRFEEADIEEMKKRQPVIITFTVGK